MCGIQSRHSIGINILLIATVCLFLINDILWVDLSASSNVVHPTFTLAAESRLKPFSEKHGLDFRNTVAAAYIAKELKDLEAANKLTEGSIIRLNKYFPNGDVEVGREIKTGIFQCSKREYKYAVFYFKKGKEVTTIYALFLDKLTDDERSELKIKDDEKHYLNYSRLTGVWFINPKVVQVSTVLPTAVNREDGIYQAAGLVPQARIKLEAELQTIKKDLLTEAQKLLDFIDGKSYVTKIGAQDFSPEEGYNPVILAVGSPSPEAFVEVANKWREYSDLWKVDVPVIASTGRGKGAVSFIANTQYYYDKPGREAAMKSFKALRDSKGDDKLTEAAVIKFIFMQSGVPENSIFLEEASANVNTLDNMVMSFDNVINDPDSKFCKSYQDATKPLKILIVADAFHRLRVLLTALLVFQRGEVSRRNLAWKFTTASSYQPALTDMDDDKLYGTEARLGYLKQWIGDPYIENSYGEIGLYLKPEFHLLDSDDSGYVELREYINKNWTQERRENLRELLKRYMEANKALLMSATASETAAQPITLQAEIVRIHTENLKHAPNISDKTILCHIIADSILPVQQRNVLKTLEQDMRDERYSEKVISLSVEGSNSLGEFMEELERIKVREEAKYQGYKVRFDVACPNNNLVGKIQGLGMQALAFAKEGDGDAVQVEGIILALRVLQTGNINNLLDVYKFLTGRELIAGTNDINELARMMIFILPVRKVDVNEIGTLNRIIEKNIKAAA